MNEYVIGVDLGGTNIRAAAVSEDGSILIRDKRDTNVSGGKEEVVKNILASIETVRKSLDNLYLKGVGIGVPGIIFADRGVVSQSPNFPDWKDFDLRARLEQDISVPLFIENDANAAAIGEGWLGAGIGFDSYLMVTLGTGLGGGVVLDTKIWHGACGMGGELGHIIVEPNGEPCGCGGWGCLEQYTSATSVKKYAQKMFFNEEASKLREICFDNPGNITSKLLYDLSRGGDKFAIDIFKRVGYYLGLGFVSLLHIFNIELIVVGGGLSEAFEFIEEETLKVINERAYKIPAERLNIKIAKCGDDAGILGAASLAF